MARSCAVRLSKNACYLVDNLSVVMLSEVRGKGKKKIEDCGDRSQIGNLESALARGADRMGPVLHQARRSAALLAEAIERNRARVIGSVKSITQPTATRPWRTN